MQSTLKLINRIIGVLAGKVKISLIVMDRIKELNLNLCYLNRIIQERHIYAGVNTRKTRHIVMELTIRCKSSSDFCSEPLFSEALFACEK